MRCASLDRPAPAEWAPGAPARASPPPPRRPTSLSLPRPLCPGGAAWPRASETNSMESTQIQEGARMCSICKLGRNEHALRSGMCAHWSMHRRKARPLVRPLADYESPAHNRRPAYTLPQSGAPRLETDVGYVLGVSSTSGVGKVTPTSTEKGVTRKSGAGAGLTELGFGRESL